VGRLDFKRGRFSIGAETRSIEKGLRGYQSLAGDIVDYWRFHHELSVEDDVYDESTGVGKVFHGPFSVPVLHVVHTQGQDTAGGTQGLYSVDTLQVTAGFRQLARVGLTRQDVRTNAYVRDRITYDEKVFGITQITALGQIKRADLIVSITAVQTKADELVNDAQFAAYAVDPDALN
jgi:hypothetical protein